MKIIPTSFLSNAAAILADTSDGLTGNQIVTLCNVWAARFDVDTPHASYPFGAPNKRTALLENIAAFPAERQCEILIDLCDCFDQTPPRVAELRRSIKERFIDEQRPQGLPPSPVPAPNVSVQSPLRGSVPPRRHVFLSYCKENREDVRELRSLLIRDGERVWWDQDILGGQDWKLEIYKAMKNAYAVVLCLSVEMTNRSTSGVYPEMMDAIAAYRSHAPGNIFVIPLRLSECEIPPIAIDGTRMLDSLNYIDLFLSDGYAKLQASLRAAHLRD